MGMAEVRRSQFLPPHMREDLAWYNALLRQQGLRPVTVRMYADDYLRYLEFCKDAVADHWSIEAVERYFKHLVAGDSISLASARRLVSGLRKGFIQRGSDPFVGSRWRGFYRGIKLRSHAPSPKNPGVSPISRRRIVDWAALPVANQQPHAVRNRALVLLGWTSALSGSELQSLRVDQLLSVPEGIALHFTGYRARTVLVYPAKRGFCDPIDAVQTWRTLGGIDRGYVFRSINQNGLVTDQPLTVPGIKHIVREAFADDTLNANSLQAGWITTALADGCPVVKVHTYTRIATERLMHDYSEFMREAEPAQVL
jgi:site-specific recombinase XerD